MKVARIGFLPAGENNAYTGRNSLSVMKSVRKNQNKKYALLRWNASSVETQNAWCGKYFGVYCAQ